MLYDWSAQAIPAELKLVTATIAAAWTTVTTSADADLVWGKIIGFVPISENTVDAHVKKVSIAATWAITVTLSSASTAEVKYSVIVARATWEDS